MTKEFEPIKEEDTLDFSLPVVEDKSIEIDDVIGTIPTVSAVPTGKPVRFSQQLKIYKSGSTRRLYWYDTLNQEWVYTSGSV